MKRDVMLPKFNLPGQTTWLMKGLWIAGAVVLVQVGVVGTLLLRDRIGDSEPAPAQAAPAPQPAAAAAAKAPEPATVGEPSSEPGVQPARQLAGVRPGSPVGPGPSRMNRGFGPSKPGMARLRGKGRRGGDRVFARTSFGARKAALPKAGRKGALPGGPRANAPRPAGRNGKPDAIDQLLRNFK
jgi:hypothetical protein